MAIPGISDALLKTAFVSSTNEGQQTRAASKKTPRDTALFIASMTLYLDTLNELIKSSWQKFHETETEIAQQKNADYRIHAARHAQLEGERNRAEALKQDEEAELVRCGVHRQAGKLRFYEGSHLDHRNLYIAV